jgi:hypothetical protein
MWVGKQVGEEVEGVVLVLEEGSVLVLVLFLHAG